MGWGRTAWTRFRKAKTVGAAGVEFADVSFTLADGRALLKDVSLKLEAGTTTALLGRSGSGKTTLMRMVNGLGMPSAGKVMVGGRRDGSVGFAGAAAVDWVCDSGKRAVSALDGGAQCGAGAGACG